MKIPEHKCPQCGRLTAGDNPKMLCYDCANPEPEEESEVDRARRLDDEDDERYEERKRRGEDDDC